MRGKREKAQYLTVQQFEKLYDELLNQISFLKLNLLVGGEATHQIQTFTFTNSEGTDVNDLRVVFNTPDVKTKDKGPFRKAVTINLANGGSSITLTGLKHDIGNGGNVELTFERDGPFQVTSWQWTKDTKDVGSPKSGAPPESF